MNIKSLLTFLSLIFVCASNHILSMEESPPLHIEKFISTLPEEDKAVVPGATHFIIHRHGQCTMRNKVGERSCEAGKCPIEHNPDTKVITFHDSLLNVLKTVDSTGSDGITFLYLQEAAKWRLDPQAKPEAEKATIENYLKAGRHIVFYDKYGLDIFYEKYTGSAHVNQEDLARFRHHIDIPEGIPIKDYWSKRSLLQKLLGL